MVKFQVVIRPKRKDKNGLVNVEVMASCGGVRIHLVTGFKVKPQQFRAGMVVGHAASDQINTAVQLQMAGYIERSIRFTGTFTGMTATRLRRMLTEGAARQVTFESVIRQRIDQCQRRGAVKSAQLLLYTYNKIANRYKGITFDQITPAFLRNFETDLTSQGIRQNTIALLMRYIRLTFNQAIADDLIPPELYPFRKFRIKSEKTAKRRLTIDELRRLRTVDHPAVDIFFLSFMLIGINIKDLLFARPDQVSDNRLHYTRSKTGKPISVYLFPDVREMIEKHKGEKLLLNFMERRKRLDQFNKWINKHLGKAAASVGITKHITTYAARHSWATVASGLGISKDVIAQALGHSATTVTDIYIDFDIKKVDKANEQLIQLFNL